MQRNLVNSVDNVMKLSTFTDNSLGNQCVKFCIIALYSSWKISKISLGGYFLARPVEYVSVEYVTTDMLTELNARVHSMVSLEHNTRTICHDPVMGSLNFF